MEIVKELLSALWDIWMEMFNVLTDIIPKAINFILWVLSGLIILPCVFISGIFFPMWTEWGEGM